MAIDALQLLGYSNHAIRVRDDRFELNGCSLMGCVIEAPAIPSKALLGWIHVAVGAATTRKQLFMQSGLPLDRWLTIIHPHATVARSSSLGPGSLVAAQAVIGPCVKVNASVIVNHGAVIEHDCYVGAFSHISTNASLAGGVQIGDRVLIGAGARILPGLCIGNDAVIGAGAIVLNDVPSGETWSGVPARQHIKKNK